MSISFFSQTSSAQTLLVQAVEARDKLPSSWECLLKSPSSDPAENLISQSLS